jgi:hypothetical protein
MRRAATDASETAGGDRVEPSAVWTLGGDGVPTVGDAALTFFGAFELTDEAVAFDGATGFGTTSAGGPVATAESFSVAAWVNLARPADYAAAVSQLSDVALTFYLGYAEGSWSFGMKDADTNAPGHTFRASSAPADPDPSAWVHLVGVYDDAAQQIRLYVDSERVAEVSFTATWQADGPLTVGRAQAHGAPADFWPGAVEDLRLYSIAIDDTQVQTEYEDHRPASPPPAIPVAPAGFVCSHGGACLGPLDAGTYATQIFSPAITYTVPDGWTNGEDLLGNFLLQLEGDPRYLGIYRNVAVPFECEEKPDPSVDQSIEALSSWLTEHPGLQTTEPIRVSVGGLDGVYLDISLASSWTTTCPFSEGQPVVPFIIGGDPSSLHHVILPGFEVRLYLLEYEDGNVAIEVGPEGGSLEEYLEEVAPIIESLQFAD